MIRLNDLVKLKVCGSDDPRDDWMGIVTNVRVSVKSPTTARSVGQTVTVLWPVSGCEENWIGEALDVIQD